MNKKLYRLIHKLGFHNEKCRRRIFTTKNTYLCLITGNKHKILYDELQRIFKKK